MELKKRNYIRAALAVVVFICIYLVVVLGYWFYGKGRIYPNISVAGFSVSQKTDEEASELLRAESVNFAKSDISIGGDKLDTTKLDLTFDLEETVAGAKEETRRNPFLLGFEKEYPLVASYNEDYVYEYLYSLEKKYNKAPENSSVRIENNELEVVNGSSGQQINYSETIYSFEQALKSLSSSVEISLIEIPPTYSAKDLEKKKSEIENIFSNGLTLSASEKEIEVPVSSMVSWVQLSSNRSSECEYFEGEDFFLPFYDKGSEDSLLSIGHIENYLSSLSGDLDYDPVNAQLTMENNKVAVFSESKNGRELDISKSAITIKDGLRAGSNELELSFNYIEPDVHLGSINDLGIKELIATGYSVFSGSPANRRHNIRVGASKFNGLLVEPGETFSFTSQLGEVDAANGYLPELVIKNNETIPEYGGGLCQVSSTAFRAALNAGLPITARKAHSYPVSYYKPYGTDATIYVPNPDLKFKNDTGKHILIQTRIVGNYLYFDFYGTRKDISVAFAGNKNASGATSKVEWVTPYTYDHGGRGEGSFKAIVYRFIYDSSNKLIDSEYFFSNYDSPDKYPH